MAIRIIPKKSFGGYARMFAKSESNVISIRFSRSASSATVKSSAPDCGRATLKPHSLSEATTASYTFSSQSTLNRVFSGFEYLARIVKHRFNVFTG